MFEPRYKRRRQTDGGRGVTAAQQTFNLAGEGSIPSGPTEIPAVENRAARSSTVRAGVL